MNDGYSVTAPLPHRPPLDPLLGIIARCLVGTLCDSQALQPDLLPGFVHHREHVRQALVLPAHQVADGTFLLTKAHNASGTSVDAELVLDRRAHDIVALRQ